MVICPDCHASVDEAHDALPACGGQLHATEEQREVACIAEAEGTRSARFEARDAVIRMDREDEDRSRTRRLVPDVWDELDPFI